MFPCCPQKIGCRHKEQALPDKYPALKIIGRTKAVDAEREIAVELLHRERHVARIRVQCILLREVATAVPCATAIILALGEIERDAMSRILEHPRRFDHNALGIGGVRVAAEYEAAAVVRKNERSGRSCSFVQADKVLRVFASRFREVVGAA